MTQTILILAAQIPGYRETKLVESSFPGYFVSSMGEVLSTRCGKLRILKQKMTAYGYLLMCLYRNNKKEFRYTHKLVAETFLPNPKNKKQVDHINGIKTDNRLSNLRWATIGENASFMNWSKKNKKNNLPRCITKSHKAKTFSVSVKRNGVSHCSYGHISVSAAVKARDEIINKLNKVVK